MMNLRSLIFLPLVLLESGCSDTGINPIKDPPVEGIPQIQAIPSSLDFGVIPAGENASQVVTIASIGSVSLDINAMQVGEGRWAFALVEPAVGLLEPGTSTDVTVTYNSQGTTAEGTLEILSNDPANPNLGVPLLAQEEEIIDSGDTGEEPALQQPVAVCRAEPDEILAIHETSNWIGSDSYDPDGTIDEYRWTLISEPSGNTATMPPGGADRYGFAPDVAGEFIAELVVVDNDGFMSEPCEAILNATAGDGLWVEMFWTRSGDDMDLHLLDDGGTLTTNSDCYYGNCTWGGLDWGVRGSNVDDPILDLDDIPGVGPENINIDSPARGTYTVYVHDYPGSVYTGRNDVTVNVYWGGSLVWTDTRNVNLENCYEPFVEVEVPGGITTDLAGSCR